MQISIKSFIRATVIAATLFGANAILAGCAVTVPDGVRPVTDFDINRYLGTWYELARIDHKFEKDLTQVSAHYTMNADGGITVLNRGFDSIKNEWREVEGTARFLGAANVAALKVSFFGPFYGGYNVVILDDDYQTALVIGENKEYFWLLSRDKKMDKNRVRELLEKARGLGVDVNRIVLVAQ
ncbi:apolipoprotein D and lipocalin family protein [Comamonas odontotermitis]|uniref:Outer membrane lipoprotein Blc n=1 Tax=Comamonas odontotermitis TaxID=379895 RepID=A0ABR6RLJ0_9BURK|nr:lipocalin family protein [Comamonas odontotermitis]MBB6580038.1 apolipoprotein D and lipocalin family protein [Comamonas odontotermitis]